MRYFERAESEYGFIIIVGQFNTAIRSAKIIAKNRSGADIRAMTAFSSYQNSSPMLNIKCQREGACLGGVLFFKNRPFAAVNLKTPMSDGHLIPIPGEQ